jgi:anti-anti-sigma factor
MPEERLTLTIEDCGETAVVHCRGQLVAGVGDRLYQAVSKLIPTHRRIVLDLAELTHMDSMGLGTLMRIYLSAKTKGCRIDLRNLGERIRKLMIMTNLLSVFTVIGEHGVRM